MFKRKRNKISTDSMDNGVNVATVGSPNSVVAEQFKTIRTNIQFSNAGERYKTLMITSSTVSEGKSTVAANIAVEFANQGLKTLLVDADTRRPTVNRTFSISNLSGLTNFLTDKTFNLKEAIHATSVNDLYIMQSGPTPPNPAELINSQRMNDLINYLSKTFDLVIFDVPPVLAVTDAQILSSKVAATILVTRMNYSEKEAVRQAIGLLNKVNCNLIGTIINDKKSDINGYYGYYGKK